VRKFALPILITGALLLAACGGPDAGVQQATPTAQPQPQSSPTAAAANASPTRTPWVPPTALAGTPIPGAVATLTAAPRLPVVPLSITNTRGEKRDMMVEVADTDASRQLGLMHRAQMDPNAGMLFSWQEDTTGGFWMFNTILPLSIAFISADGTIVHIADMQPLDQSTVGPSGPYRHALETNQGFFDANDIEVGNKVTLPGAQSIVIPGMPACPVPPQGAATR
jgi:uncharacterized protein